MTTNWLFLFSPLLEKNKSINFSQDTGPPLGYKRRLIHSIPIKKSELYYLIFLDIYYDIEIKHFHFA